MEASYAAAVDDPRDNELLAALPAEVWANWAPQLQAVELSSGQPLTRCGAPSPFVLFPTSAIVSLLCMAQEGGNTEICVVGKEGVVGVAELDGGSANPSQPVVQGAGRGYRLRAELVTEEIRRGGAVLSMLWRYGQGVLAQVAQTALCNRYHSIEQQLCRRLLMGLDRSTSNELSMTHAAMANLLGVRREGVSTAAFRLQAAGVIRYSRGRIEVLSRARLEKLTCECYWAGHEHPRPANLDVPDSRPSRHPLARTPRHAAMVFAQTAVAKGI
jgi:CRP-like cAMP-binding protein